MKLMSVVSCACIAALCGSAQAGLVYGQSARDQFEDLQTQLGEGYLDFESKPAGYNLMPGADPFGVGVRFASVVSTSGAPFGPFHVEVSNRHGFATYGNTIVGSPCGGCSDDGRVGYEIVFDTPQRRAGLLRSWGTDALTSFYDEAGILLDSHQLTVNPEFVGWMADTNDGSDWVKRIVMDTVVTSGTRQVGHSDDLYFGTLVPAPAGALGMLLGIGCVTRRRR